MADLKADTMFEHVVQQFEPQSKLLRTWELKGGVSAQVTAIEIERPDGCTQKMIVRQHGEVELKHNPHIAADEFKLLQLLHSIELAVPEPYYLDQSGEIFPTPYIVIEYIEGEPIFGSQDVADFIPQLAMQLYRIHKVDCAKLDVSFLPLQEKRVTEKLGEGPEKVDEALDEGCIRDVLLAGWPFPRQNRSVLLHGDFWPGNILWRDGQIVGVIDWEDATLGDPLADVANSRLELLWAFGIDTMRSFTFHYQSLTDIEFSNLPYWDLYTSLRRISQITEWGLDDNSEKTMRERLRWFVAQAFMNL